MMVIIHHSDTVLVQSTRQLEQPSSSIDWYPGPVNDVPMDDQRWFAQPVLHNRNVSTPRHVVLYPVQTNVGNVSLGTGILTAVGKQAYVDCVALTCGPQPKHGGPFVQLWRLLGAALG